MSFTRFHDDPCRIQKHVQQSTGPGRYILDVPGNGLKPSFMVDPYMRMQKWGANLMTDTINLENRLKGLDRLITSGDCKQYNEEPINSRQVSYPNCMPFTDQTRTTHPAWGYRDLENNNWSYLHLNPQENVFIPFHNNLNTRIIEKDAYVPKAPNPELL